MTNHVSIGYISNYLVEIMVGRRTCQLGQIPRSAGALLSSQASPMEKVNFSLYFFHVALYNNRKKFFGVARQILIVFLDVNLETMIHSLAEHHPRDLSFLLPQ